MQNDNPFNRMDKIIKEIKDLDEKHTSGQEEESDPRVAELIAKGMRTVRELDPIVRETFRDNPEALAEWDSIMQDFYKLEEEDSLQAEANKK